MNVSLSFLNTQGNVNGFDGAENLPISAESGQFLPIPNVGDLVSYSVAVPAQQGAPPTDINNNAIGVAGPLQFTVETVYRQVTGQRYIQYYSQPTIWVVMDVVPAPQS